ncbi:MULTISPECIES: potassium channel family protein [Halorussus]|uniref:potassium channel family protein n=1 Tax=Halorussus TaxID=1070314 RepID=UPI0020A120ED|nr:TrkA family potassium uptake protein [Halorussus vallis]USZ76018.1 TrkA family potassium uptake protein [Halorussus vallis]
MYIIIVGAGQIGTPLIEAATREGNDVAVIEYDEERANRAATAFDALVINDDATVKETLYDAGAERADAIISTTDQDATNTMVCLLAKEIEIPEIVSVVHNPDHMSLFRQIGVHTIENPQRLIADYLYRAVKRPAIIDFMHLGGDAEVFEIAVAEDAAIAGKTIQEADEQNLLGEDTLIVAIEQPGDEPPLTPKGKTRIEAGDVLTVYSASGATPDVTDAFGHYEDHESVRR